MSESSQHGNNGPGQVIASVRSIRLAIFIITTSLIAACAIFNVIDFDKSDALIDLYTNETKPVDIFYKDPTEISPVYLFLCGLSLSAISVFLKTGFIIKLIMMMLCISVQTIILYTSNLFATYDAVHNDSL